MARRSPQRYQESGRGFAWRLVLAVIVLVPLSMLGVRAFLVEPFSIPSGSMIPTLLVGDYLFVSKYAYGYSRHSLPLSPPLFSGRVFGALPERGDVAVFKLPKDASTDYIKRIVGLPGDRVQMRNGRLWLNGVMVPRRDAGMFLAEGGGPPMKLRHYVETLPAAEGGRSYDILKASDNEPLDNTPEYRVPEGHVFALGDNRNNSLDSRIMSAVGFIPIENLVGRAEVVFFSVDTSVEAWAFWEWPFAVRWSRLFRSIS